MRYVFFHKGMTTEAFRELYPKVGAMIGEDVEILELGEAYTRGCKLYIVDLQEQLIYALDSDPRIIRLSAPTAKKEGSQ